jgi:hypothetical protein
MKSVSKQLFGRWSVRAIFVGALVDVGGSLVVTTIVGVTAVTALLVRGEAPEAIIQTLPGSLALVLFCAIGGALMSVAGGYAAAVIAGRAEMAHALAAGLLAAALNLGVNLLLGDSGPIWLTATGLVLVAPFAIFGGWLAMPTTEQPVEMKSSLD